ncbi:MAG: porin family protein [Saprospiraceae bacterium]
MNKFAIIILAFFGGICTIYGQNNFGIKVGLSSETLNFEEVQTSGLSLAIKNASYGFHIGLFARGNLSNRVFIQPELLFNSNTVDFTVTDLADGLLGTVLTEKYQNLDIPVMAGLKYGPLRLQAGPVGHVHIASKSELGEISNYKERFKDFTLGYQAGVGLDIWRLLLDVRYEGNFTKFGDHMRVGGEQIKFSQNPNRWVMSVGLAF